ncbi:hypothetical protein L462_03597 [Enterobacter sp. BIDMC 26]|nr:hypothetical protein L462_03597 [Enterobacter sp. BIDMC 26]
MLLFPDNLKPAVSHDEPILNKNYRKPGWYYKLQYSRPT